MKRCFPLAVCLLCVGAAPARPEPLRDVPRDHPAAWAVASLWRAGIVRGDEDGLFRGDRALTREEAVVFAARLYAYVSAGFVMRTGQSIDDYLVRWRNVPAWDELNPYRGTWAATEWNYLRFAMPDDADVLAGWPDPLPTRYDAALAAARVLVSARRVARSAPVRRLNRDMGEAAKGNDTQPLDWTPWSEGEDPHSLGDMTSDRLSPSPSL